MSTRNRIFVSYSRRDRKLFEEFKTMLAPAIQRGTVDLWDDLKIAPGANWKEEIRKALSSAKIAVLLVSQNFLASHFIAEEELPPLLKAAKEEGLTIFWICLSSCLFEGTEIATYQAAHDVSRPLDRLSKPERQAVLSQACGRLIKVTFETEVDQGPKREEPRRESSSGSEENQVQSDVAKIQTIFSDVGLALSDLNTSIVHLRLDLLEYAKHNPQVEQYLGDSLPERLKRDVLGFTSTLAKLREALGQVQTDSLARVCWVKAVAAHTLNSLTYIQSQLEGRGFSRTEVSVPISDIPLILQFLSLAPRKLQSFTFEPLVTAILQTNLADAVGKPYNHEALRTFVFGGNLIASISEDKVHVPLGAAILCDIYQSIPDATSFRDALREKYAAYSGRIESMQLALVREEFVSSDFRFAVGELRKRQDVLVLDIPHRHRESQ